MKQSNDNGLGSVGDMKHPTSMHPFTLTCNENNSPQLVRYKPSALHSRAPAASIGHRGVKSCAYHPRTTNTAVCSKSNHQPTFASEESVPTQQSVAAVGFWWNAGQQLQWQWKEQEGTIKACWLHKCAGGSEHA